VLTEYELHRLLLLRDEKPDAGVRELLGRLDLKDKTLAEAAGRLTDASACHSLWITTCEATRRWHRLTVVQQGDAENDAGRWTFVW